MDMMNGALRIASTTGFYWSSSAASAPLNFSYYLAIGYNFVEPSNNNPRWNGFTGRVYAGFAKVYLHAQRVCFRA